MEMLLDNVGERLAYLRENVMNASQAELSHLFGMSQSNLSSIEIGRTNPTLRLVLLYANFCNVSPSWILQGIGQGPNPVKTNRRNLSVTKLDNAASIADIIIKDLPARLRFWRENGLDKVSQHQLSEMMEISQSVISEIERGKLVPTIEYITSYSETLNLEIDLLLCTPDQLLLTRNISLSAHPLYEEIMSTYTPKRDLIKAEDIVNLIEGSFNNGSELRKVAAVLELMSKYIDQENKGGKE